MPPLFACSLPKPQVYGRFTPTSAPYFTVASTYNGVRASRIAAQSSLIFLRRQPLNIIRLFSATEHKAKAAGTVRNPLLLEAHNFKETEAKRPDFDHSNTPILVTKSPDPNWKYGAGVAINASIAALPHKEIDPYAPHRPMVYNYQLLISGIVPRPIGFVSTVSADGKTENLAPFSYFQVVEHDPPMFIVSFSSRRGRMKDTYQNLRDTGECVINTVSENMIEAVNATSIDGPQSVSEWDISGLHKAPTSTVKPKRVRESIFSIEGKVEDTKEFTSHAKEGKSLAGLVLIKATRFWVREDAANEDFSNISLDKLRPVGQLGGMAYGRITSTFDLPRGKWSEEQAKSEHLSQLIKSKEQPMKE